MDLALNNLQRLICHKTPTNQPTNQLNQKQDGYSNSNMIYWELYEKFKFDNYIKWYVHKPESVLKNKTHNILWDFEIQTIP